MTMGSTLNGPFREVVSLARWNIATMVFVWVIVWDPNKAIDIGELSICGRGQLKKFYSIWMMDTNKVIDIVEWPICGGGWLERFYCICMWDPNTVIYIGEWLICGGGRLERLSHTWLRDPNKAINIRGSGWSVEIVGWRGFTAYRRGPQINQSVDLWRWSVREVLLYECGTQIKRSV